MAHIVERQLFVFYFLPTVLASWLYDGVFKITDFIRAGCISPSFTVVWNPGNITLDTDKNRPAKKEKQMNMITSPLHILYGICVCKGGVPWSVSVHANYERKKW